MLKDHETTWKACLNVIKDNISLQAFKVWFEPIIPVKLENSILTIQVPSHFLRMVGAALHWFVKQGYQERNWS